MKVRFTERADKDYAVLTVNVRKAFAKQLGFLMANHQYVIIAIISHPK